MILNRMFKKILAWKLKIISRRIIAKYKPKIIGITGSFGKSSAKEAVFSVISGSGLEIRRSRGNFNNEFGFPLAVIGDFKKTGGIVFWIKVVLKGIFLIVFGGKKYPDILILEYGADKPGDIDYLVKIARPDIAVVTGISEIPVHVEFYPDARSVASEKSKLVRALPKNGTAVLNGDDPYVADMAEKTTANTVFYGFSPQADFKISQFSNRSDAGVPIGISFKLENIGKSVPITMKGTIGKAQAYAAAAAVACGSILKINLFDAEKRLSEYKPLPGRSKIIEGVKGSWLIDDTYNSSPKAAEEILLALKELKGTRKIVVLGGMMELGKYSGDAHRNIGKLAADCADIVVGVGDLGKLIIAPASEKGKEALWFASSFEAGKTLADKIKGGDIILIKGSQSARMERVTEALMSDPKKSRKLLVRQYGKWLKD